MKKKNKVIGCFFICLCAGVYLFAFNEEKIERIALRPTTAPEKLLAKEEPKISKAEVVSPREDMKLEAESEANQESARRAPASIPRPDMDVVPEWKSRLKERLTETLSEWGSTPEMKSLGSRVLKTGDKQASAEHVVISIDRGDGNVSSYEAYVDPETGTILRTWNQTRFEQKEPLLLKVRPLRP